MRCRTKNKEARNRLEARQTGGGPAKDEVLTSVEDEVLQIIKKVSIEGHDVEESALTFQFDDNKENRFVTSSPVETETVQNPEPESVSQIEETQTQPSVNDTSCIRKKKSKKMERVLNSSAAVSTYEKYLQEKLQIKREYYNEKIQHFRNVQNLKQKQIEALQRIADNLKPVKTE